MCSAYDTTENYEKAKKSGMVDFMPKPVTKEILKKIIINYY